MNEPYTERHWHWEFVAFDHPDAEPSGAIDWAVRVSVLGYLSEADARIAVQDIVQRQHYKLSRVFECNTCGFQSRITKTMSDLADAARG